MITTSMVTVFMLVLVPPVATAPAGDTIREVPPLELVEVLESALRTHPAVAGAEARLDAASAAAGEARAARLPTLAAMATATRYQEPMVVAPLHGFDIQSPPRFDEQLYQGHATAEYTLFDGGARSARIRAAAALAESARSGLAASRDQVLVEATSAYLAALTARDVRQAGDEWVRALEEERARARLLFDEGKTARVAVLRTEAALSRARAERAAADETLRLALHRLVRVSGLEPDRVRAEALAAVGVRDTAVPDRDTLVARARSANPGLARAEGQLAAATTRVEGARSSYLPTLSLSGRYSAFGSESTELVWEWQAGVQLSYPLFTGGARVSAVDRAEAEAAAARADRALAERQVADGVDAALLAYRSARARVAALEAAVEQSAEVARIEALALATGAGVQTDYLRAEAELMETRSQLAEARHAAVEARVRLAQVTGTLTVTWLTQMTEGAER